MPFFFQFLAAGVAVLLYREFSLLLVGAIAVSATIAYYGIEEYRKELRRHLIAHLGGNEPPVLTHVVRPTERVNLQVVLDRELARRGRVLYCATVPDDMGQILKKPGLHRGVARFERLPCSPDAELDCAENALYLLHDRGNRDRPYAALIRHSDDLYGEHAQMVLEVMAPNREAAQAALDHLRRAARECDVYRGHVLHLRCSDNGSLVIHFHKMPAAAREDIVLPDGILDVVERNVLGFLKHREVLKAARRDLRRGVLLYGPPGNGKSLLTRYLARACKDYTVIPLTGGDLGLVRPAFAIARLLAPSMIVMEDVDLVAEHRDTSGYSEVLNVLLDEMDGLGTRTECVFLLTTNRPEVLEPALAARPGRVDQTVHIPLPDASCRHRLIELFGAGLHLDADIDRWVAETDGTSAAFLKELLRKAALIAAERGSGAAATPLTVCDDDLEHAMHEILGFGGALSHRLLSCRTGFTSRAS